MARDDYTFSLDGVKCTDKGIILQEPVAFGAASLRVETVAIPGHNGDLHFYEPATFDNVKGSARCYVLQDGKANKSLQEAAVWLLSKQGYRRLETSDESGIYRQAAIANSPEVAIRMRTLATFAIEFDCKPQKFLLEGEKPISVTNGMELSNPGMPSKPRLEIKGSGQGSVTVGDVTVQLKETFSGLTLDCETMDAYTSGKNCNKDIDVREYPTIPSGKSVISWSGGVSGVTIYPRWWVL